MTTQAPSLQEMLEGLISAPSISSLDPTSDTGNMLVCERLAAWLESSGFQVALQHLDAQVAKANLIATKGRGPGGLVLAGHLDTVPFDEDAWHQDPLRLVRRDNRLYGLGTSDMKSFLALAIEAARGLDPSLLRQPLIILGTADEESSMSGARALAAAGRPLGRHAVIGEPTGLRPVRMHKGVMGHRIQLTGQSGHASDPSLGRNALDGMHAVIGELLSWRQRLKSTPRSAGFAVPHATLNLGALHGGDNPNRICGQCELLVDMRVLPGQSVEELEQSLSEQVRRVAKSQGLDWRVDSLFPPVPPAETAAEAAVVRAAEDLTGHAAGAVSFGTEAPYLNAMGCETLVLGPGDIAQAHQGDEYLSEERIQPTIELLQALIRRFCIEPAG